MRILCFCNNWVGWQALKWLKQEGENIVGLVIHPAERRKYSEEIIQTADLNPAFIFDGSQLRQPEIIEAIRQLKPDFGISALFGYILREELINLMPKGCINIHPAFLPFNRGAYPNVWSIIEGTPAGATIHFIDAGVDTGDIIARKQVAIEPVDTGESLYHKLEKACVELFKETWCLIRSGETPHIPQSTADGTFHRMRDVKEFDEIDLNRTYKAVDLLNLIRARTFPPYPGAFFKNGERKVYLRLQLLYEEDLTAESEESHV